MPVWPDLLSWLRARRDGIVLVDPELARIQLGDFGPFLAEAGVNHGRALLHLLSRSPRIFVAQAQQQDAA